MAAPSYIIEPLVLPADLTAPEAGDFREFCALSDAVVLQTWGNLDRATTPEARLAAWRDDDYKQLRLFFIRLEGKMVARAWIRFPMRENTHGALVRVDVLDDFTGKGLGCRLLAHLEKEAAVEQRTTLLSFTEHVADFDPDGPEFSGPPQVQAASLQMPGRSGSQRAPGTAWSR